MLGRTRTGYHYGNMSKRTFSITLPGIVWRDAFGLEHTLPWRNVSFTDYAIRPNPAAREVDPGLPRSFWPASARQERVARKLLQRQVKRDLQTGRHETHWGCRSIWLQLLPAFLGPPFLGLFVWIAPRASRGNCWNVEVLAEMFSTHWAITWPFVIAFGGCLAAGAIGPFILLRHHIRTILNGRRVVSLRTDANGARVDWSDGSQTFHAWHELCSATAPGVLRFRGQGPATIAFFPMEVMRWREFKNVLTQWRLRPPSKQV